MNAAATSVHSTEEDQIRHLMAEREIAMRGRDAETIVARYSAGTVKFDLSPPLQHTGAEVVDVNRLRTWFAGFDGPIEYEIRDLSVTAAADLAFAHSLNRLSTTPKGSPQPFNLWFRATVCLRRVDGAWQITHEHNSTPFYMDVPFKAAIDLQP
jgi:ketosteroid isomerase-like protein